MVRIHTLAGNPLRARWIPVRRSLALQRVAQPCPALRRAAPLPPLSGVGGAGVAEVGCPFRRPFCVFLLLLYSRVFRMLEPPVVWREGMHLSQHHFQAQGRYFEALATFALRQLSPSGWGWLDVRLDDEALANGTATLLAARGILPDGTPFELSENTEVHPLPAPLPLGELASPTRVAYLLHLALPADRPDRGNVDTSDGAGSETTGPRRYREGTRLRLDETGVGGAATLAVALPRFQLLLEGEDPLEPGFVTLPVARLRRDPSGRFVQDRAFVPPALDVAAVPWLSALLSRLLEQLEARATGLRAERSRGGPAGEADATASLWLAHALHASLGALRPLAGRRPLHPEALFHELARLAGALATFTLEGGAERIPVYDHADPEPGFLALDSLLRAHLDTALPEGALLLPLVPARPERSGKDEVLLPAEGDPSSAFRMTSIRDPRAFGAASWTLVIEGASDPGQVAVHAREGLKVCSARFVARLVREALPGLGFVPLPTPPKGVPLRPGAVYLALDRAEPCWTAIVKGGELGIHLPGRLAATRITLAIVPGTPP